nr:nucleoside triphosphate pyrophosphohydrolase family protein [Neolewinella persica]
MLAHYFRPKVTDMTSPRALEDVAEFHRTFHLPVLDTPQIPDADRCRLRMNLLQEELNELAEAIENNDLVEAADAFADLQYVLSGAILEFGLGEKFRGLFEEVHRSNMSKTCATMEEAEATVAHYAAKGQTGVIEPSGKVYLVYRTSDRKVLKNKFYSPADLKSMIK